MPAKQAAVKRMNRALEANARKLFLAMDYPTRLKIFEACGAVNDNDRGEQAVRYLCEPVHLAQFKIWVFGGQPHIKWAAN
jgi:hypothetical protein